MKRLKIGFVFDDTLDTADGVQQYLQTKGKWLADAGHEVHYLVGETIRKDIANIHSLSKNTKVRFNHNRLSIPLPANRAKIRELLAKENFDVLHVQMPYSPWLAGRVILEAPLSTAIVGTFHIMPASGFHALATKLLGIIVRRSLKRIDAIVSVSLPAQEFAASSFKIVSDILPNSVDFSRFKNGKKLDKFDDGKVNIVTMGRLVERKGASYLIEAFTKMNNDNSRLIICGKGPLLNKLQSLAEQLGVTEQVVFAGYIDEKDKADYLASADIAVYPSTGGESFGIVLVEAGAAGAGVVLAGDNPGYRSVMAARSDALIQPKDIEKFSGKLQHYVEDADSQNKLHSWQQKHFKQFDVAVVGPKLLDLYNRTLQRKHKVR